MVSCVHDPKVPGLIILGPSNNSDKDAAAARANHPIPPACGIYYFEVEILGKEQKASVIFCVFIPSSSLTSFLVISL